MNMANRDTKRGRGSRLRSPVTWGVAARCVILCLMFVPLRLLTSLTGIALANTATEIPQALPQDGLSVPGDANSPPERELLRADISVPEGQEDKQTKSKLRQMIEQVRSVAFGPDKQAPEPPVVAPKAPVTEPNETPPDRPAQRQDGKKEIESELPYEPVVAQTLEMLKSLSQQPDRLDNPLELGEVLFSSGRLKEAAAFYQEALNRKDPNDANSPQDRAWILFQIGNCLRNLEPPTAAKRYAQLLTEYPQSPWTDLAKAEGQLIDWYLKDEPRKLIGQVENPPGK